MNKDVKQALNTIKTFLGMEVKLEDVQLAQMKLADGVTVIEFDSLEAGKDIFVVTENGNIPMPMGEYELEDGNILVVSEDGIIGEVKPKETEVEQPEQEVEVEVEASVEKVEAPIKKTVETSSKETYFSEIEELKKEIANLKEQLKEKEVIEMKEEVKKVEEVIELSKPITFNPEKTNEVKSVKLTNQPKSNRDRILEIVYNK
jgi:hypothetical protein